MAKSQEINSTMLLSSMLVGRNVCNIIDFSSRSALNVPLYPEEDISTDLP